MAAAKKLSYNEAVARLDAIIAEAESGTLDIDLLATRLKEAQELIALCQAKLFAAKTTVDRLLDTSNTEP